MEVVRRMLKIPYGESSFAFIRNKNYLYIDKTRFISDLETMNKVIHLRPRRFGKSLFVTMLESYYDVAKADQFDALFKGLSIYENPTESKNNYYVLHLDFSGIATENVQQVLDGFRIKVRDGIKLFLGYYRLDIQCDFEDKPAAILSSLLTAFAELELEHKICILIDEYDHFTNAVLSNGLDDFMSLVRRGGVVRSFYEVIKEGCKRDLIGRFFITGVMSVSLDSMTSGFNIASNLTTDETFTDMMGFTAEEAKSVLRTTLQNIKNEAVTLDESEQAEIYEIWKQNYNGYLFSKKSDVKVFNSTLIMYYLQNYINKKEHPESLVDPNLNQSGSTIKQLAELKNRESNYEIVKEIVDARVVSGKLSTFIDIDKKYDQDDFITLLFNIGLLTIKEAGAWTKFEIPNKIIETIYLHYLSELEHER